MKVINHLQSEATKIETTSELSLVASHATLPTADVQLLASLVYSHCRHFRRQMAAELVKFLPNASYVLRIFASPDFFVQYCVYFVFNFANVRLILREITHNYSSNIKTKLKSSENVINSV